MGSSGQDADMEFQESWVFQGCKVRGSVRDFSSEALTKIYRPCKRGCVEFNLVAGEASCLCGNPGQILFCRLVYRLPFMLAKQTPTP